MSHSIISYLEYLRGMSKQMISTGDMDKYFLSKKSSKDLKQYAIVLPYKNLSSQISFDENDIVKHEKIKNMNLQGKNQKLTFFVGSYFISGSTGLKEFFGPLVISKVEYQDDGSFLSTNESFINMDLINKIILFNGDRDNDHIYNMVADNLLKLEEAISNFNFENLDVFIEELILNISQHYKLKILDDLSLENIYDIRTKIQTKTINYNKHNALLYIAQEPSSLSTYYAIEYFVKSIKKNQLTQNGLIQILEKAFLLENKTNVSKICFNEQEKNYFNNLLNNNQLDLPFKLSFAQIEAIKNIFENNVSYVQGPPGTGKSYTIAAIIILCIVLNKKILVVSQKKEALNAIKKHIFNILELDSSIDIEPFLFFDSSSKKETKKKVDNLIPKTQKNAISIEKNIIDNKIISLNAIKKDITTSFTMVNKKRHFHINNQNLIFTHFTHYHNNKENLQKRFNTLPLNITTFKNKTLKKIENIQKKYFKKELKKIDLIYLKNLSYALNLRLVNDIKLMNLLKNEEMVLFFKNIILIQDNFSNLSNEHVRKCDIYDLEYQEKNLDSGKLKKINGELIKYIYFKNFLNNYNKDVLLAISTLLHYNKHDRIEEQFEKIKKHGYEKITDNFPIVLSEIRNLNELLPNHANLFDIVIVDEASQVNLAEILPVFYRAKHLCVFGDHKQLGLNATGLTFSLNKSFEQILWAKNEIKLNQQNMSYEEAKEHNLLLSSSSILDFIKSHIKETNVILNEHFRSLPTLAQFNNAFFYDNQLTIMTSTPAQIDLPCFQLINVEGAKDKKSKINQGELFCVLDIIKELDSNKEPSSYKTPLNLNPKCIKDNAFNGDVAIVSYSRDQIEKIKDELSKMELVKLKNKIIVGTPEEVQGQEAHLVIFSLTIDEESKNTGHYTNVNRFNVALSRAKYFTIFIKTENANLNPLFTQCLNYFNNTQKDNFDILGWRTSVLQRLNYESTFIYELVKNYIKENLSEQIELFCNVETLGYYSDFVLYNHDNKKFASINILGNHVFNKMQKNHIDLNIEYSDIYHNRYENFKKTQWPNYEIPVNFLYDNHFNITSNKKDFTTKINEILRTLS